MNEKRESGENGREKETQREKVVRVRKKEATRLMELFKEKKKVTDK